VCDPEEKTEEDCWRKVFIKRGVGRVSEWNRLIVNEGEGDKRTKNKTIYNEPTRKFRVHGLKNNDCKYALYL